MNHLLQHFKTLTKHPQNAKELKGLILQLAIQGKLTENWRKENPNVEPASKLLQRIKQEKKVLIAEKIIKKDKALPPIEDHEKPYDLPGNWEWVKFGEIINLEMGQSPPSSSYNTIGNGEILINGPVEFTNDDNGLTKEIKFTTSPTKMCNKGDLIVCIRASIGRTNIASNYACIGRGVCAVQPYIAFDFVHHFVLGNKKLLYELGTGTTFRSVSKDPIRNIHFPLPPLEEQKAIIAIVNELFAEVEQLEGLTKTSIQLKEDFVTSALQRLSQTENLNQEWQLLHNHFTEFFTEKQNVKQLREAILQLAVQGKLTSKWRATNYSSLGGGAEGGGGIEPASELLKYIQTEKQELIAQKKIKKEKPLPLIEDHEIPYDLPDGWVWCRIADFVSVVRGGSPRPAGDPRYYNGNIPFLKVGDLTGSNQIYLNTHTHTIKEEGLYKTRMTPPNTLMLTNSGATLGVPRICSFETTFNDGIAAFIFMPDEIFKEYMFWFLKSKTKWFLETASRGQGQPNLNTDIIRETLFPLPIYEEQQAIVKEVNTLMALCDSLEEHIENSQTQIEQLMQSCLREVFEN